MKCPNCEKSISNDDNICGFCKQHITIVDRIEYKIETEKLDRDGQGQEWEKAKKYIERKKAILEDRKKQGLITKAEKDELKELKQSENHVDSKCFPYSFSSFATSLLKIAVLTDVLKNTKAEDFLEHKKESEEEKEKSPAELFKEEQLEKIPQRDSILAEKKYRRKEAVKNKFKMLKLEAIEKQEQGVINKDELIETLDDLKKQEQENLQKIDME